jgi:hypothetical protein
MMQRRTAILNLVLAAIFTLSACSSGSDAGIVAPGKQSQPATMKVVLRRLNNNSIIPVQAESAFVRVWQNTTGVNQVQQVAVPAPGDSTSLSFTLTADTAYHVAVLAWAPEGGNLSLVAGGESDGITIVANQKNAASVSVQPYNVSITGADTLHSGQPVTLTTTITGGPTSFFTWSAWFNGEIPTPLNLVATNLPATGGVSTVTFTPPIVGVDTAMYIECDFDMLMMDNGPWNTPGHTGATFVLHNPSPTLGQSPLRLPLKAPSTLGTLDVSFDRNQVNGLRD